MILQGDCINEPLLPAQLALVQGPAGHGAGLLVELMIIPLLELLAARGTVDPLVGVGLSVLPLDPVVPLHDVGVQSLLVLGAVVAALPLAGIADILALTVLLVVMFIQDVLVAVTLVTNSSHVLLGHVILHVEKEFLGRQFRSHTVTTFIEVTPVIPLVLVSDGPVLMLDARPHAQRTHLRCRLRVEAVVADDVLVESPGGFEVIHVTVCVTTFVSELLLGPGGVHSVVDGGVVADGALPPLLLLDLSDLGSLDLLHLLVGLKQTDPLRDVDGVNLGVDILL